MSADPTAGWRPASEAAEVRGLRLGVRRAARLRLPQEALPVWRTFAAAHGLHIETSSADVSDAPGGVRLGVAPTRGLRLVVLALAGPEGAAMAARALALELDDLRPRPIDRLDSEALATIADRHRALGALYGYPACCVEAFVDAHREVLTGVAPRHGDNFVAIARAAARSACYAAALDTLDGAALQAQASPLRHLPCRFDCRASLALAAALGGTGPRQRRVVVGCDGVVRAIAAEPAMEAQRADAGWWGRPELSLVFK